MDTELGSKLGAILADFEQDHDEITAVDSIFELFKEQREAIRAELGIATQKVVRELREPFEQVLREYRQELLEKITLQKKTAMELFPDIPKAPTEEFAFACAAKDMYNQAIDDLEALKATLPPFDSKAFKEQVERTRQALEADGSILPL